MLMMVLAALLLTQCRKPSIEFPTPSVTTTVNMTITAGPGSKTDITTAGGIVWSANDKIYVGDGEKYIGCLSIVSGVGNATGTFTGEVAATTGSNKTFHFYYLGNAKDYSADLASHNTSVDVDFSNQNIYEDNNHKLKNASGQHVGYGKVEGVDVEADKPITGIQVDMKSKVAIAYFCFQKGEGESATQYTGALTLSGEHIYNKMTVRFNASDFYFTPVKDGNIRLTNTTTHLKYAMLVPTGSTAEETLNFGGGATGSTTLANGIEANKFYRIDGNMPIVVKVKGPFTVDGSGTTVEFSKGNLQYLGKSDGTGTWRFAEHQWDYMGDGPNTTTGKKGNVDLGTAYADKYNTASYAAGGSETAADKAAARDLFGWGGTGEGKSYQRATINSNASDGSKVYGMLLYPDGYTAQTTATEYTEAEWAEMESSGVIFLPAAGDRFTSGLILVGSYGFYWSSACSDSYDAYYLNFGSSGVGAKGNNSRYCGYSVRLVR